MTNIDSLTDRPEFRSEHRTVTFLPEPEPRERHFTIISVDDHLVEPPDMFEGRLPAKFVERGPRVVEEADGSQLWHLDGNVYPNVGFNATVGRPFEEYSLEPSRFDEMRPGCWQIDARIRDMDLNGVYASLNFPSLLAGFAGRRFSGLDDAELGFAVMRAWNTWHIEEWAGPYPDRIIPCQVPWLNDPDVAAAEIYRNAELGFKAVSFPELLEPLGLPSLHTGRWDPFLRACEETGTVVCLHVGSSSTTQVASSDAPPETVAALFPVNAMVASVDWLFSKVPLRFPEIRIAMSEGGIGWVPSMLDRLDHNFRHHGWTTSWSVRGETQDLLPSEVLKRNFWFCAIDEPYGFRARDVIGVDHVMVEVDYPHADSTWPDTQEVLRAQLEGINDDEVRMMTYQNASALFRHPVPESALTRSGTSSPR